MKPNSKPFRLPHRIGLVAAAFVLCGWCMSLRAGEPSAIDAISLERGCNGCADASVLVLQRDGAATLTVHGNKRMGIAGGTLHGRIGNDEFDALARLALSRGVMSLQDRYEDPTLRDGPWTTTAIVRGTQEKRIFVRDDAAPDALKQFTAAVDRARAGITFAP